MRTTRFAAALGSSALLLCLIPSAVPAQAKTKDRAPSVRVYSQNGGLASNYVEPVIEVSEDAYVFAVSIDLDDQIQVLHPDFPGISVRIRASNQLHLPNFFAGFTQPRMSRASYAPYGLITYNQYTSEFNDARGTVIVLASRAPFNLERLMIGGDWNISGLRRLIGSRDPSSAIYALARYLGAKGEPIGHDFMRFAGGRTNYYASAYSQCDMYYGFGYGAPSLALYQSLGFARVTALRRAGQQYAVGYNACGQPFVILTGRSGGSIPVPVRPPGDTTVFPKSRLPHAAIPKTPRNPLRPDASVPEGVFPRSRSGRTEAAPTNDVTITAATERRAEPRDIPDRYRRSQPSGQPVPDRIRVPAQATPAPRGVPAAQGVTPVRPYRPEPSRESSPPPAARVPERVREAPAAPARVPERVREAPAAPARVPDRVREAAPPPPRPEPARVRESPPPPQPTPAVVPPPNR